jgi:hypothetical protein
LLLDGAAQPPRSLSLYAALAGAPNHSVVRGALQRVASGRIAYLTDCYRQLGHTEAEAKALSILANAAYRGLLQLANEAPESMMDVDWQAYAHAFKAGLMPALPPSKSLKRTLRARSVKRPSSKAAAP